MAGVGAALSAMDAAAQQRLLAMTGDARRTAEAAREFSAFAAAALAGREPAGDAGLEAALRLLAAAAAPRLKARGLQLEPALAPASGAGASGSAATRRQAAVFAAKVAQAALKAAVSGADKPKPESELEGVDLACCAMCVAVAFERDARLADLVLDNLLYQVAKKYADTQQSSALKSAAHVLGCVHIRLRGLHAKLMGQEANQHEKSQFEVNLSSVLADVQKPSMLMDSIAELPAFGKAHSPQYTKLVLGVANTCVTVLSQTQQYKNVYALANRNLQTWIAHLDKTSASDIKLAATLNDRVFRVLSKCASAVEANPKGGNSESMRFRILALSFMNNCTNYQPPQIIQQIHRAGIHMERISKRSVQDYKTIREFYIQSATILSNKHPESRHIHAPKTLEWEYLIWLEHFASVCENVDAPVESAVLMESAIHYLWKLGDIGQLIARCLCCSVAGTLFSLSVKIADGADAATCASCDERLKILASKLFTELMTLASDNAKPFQQWEKGARLFLKKTTTSADGTLDIANSEVQPLLSFITRCLRRGSSKLYNLTTSSSIATRTQLRSQVINSFDYLCSLLQRITLEKRVDPTMIEPLVLTESRLLRLCVVMSIRCLTGKSIDDDCKAKVSSQIEKFQKVVENAISQNAQATIMQGILADLNVIARESYACAARFYQNKNFRGTISSLIGAFDLAESYLEYIMCSEKTMEEIVTAHEQLKIDAIVSLLAFCFNEVGDLRRARIFIGHSILYCTSADGVSQSSTDKYVAAVLKEFELNPRSDRDMVLLEEIQHLMEGITSAYRSRQLGNCQIIKTIRAFRLSFDQASNRTMLRLRAMACDDQPDKSHLVDTIKLCCECEIMLDRAILNVKCSAIDKDDARTIASLNVGIAIAQRKVCFCIYYSNSKCEDLIRCLVEASELLTASIDTLCCSKSGAALGMAHGWRGILNLEIALLQIYCKKSVCDPLDNGSNGIDNSLVCDFENCVNHLAEADLSTEASCDAYRILSTLCAICDALSLISCHAVEFATRTLLNKFLQEMVVDDSAIIVGPPPSFEFVEALRKNHDVFIAEDISALFVPKEDENPHISTLFRAADESIANAFRCRYDSPAIFSWIQQAATALDSIKSMAAKSSLEITKATGARQSSLHLLLSNLFFISGQIESAIAESKAALGICWKLSKKFASHSFYNEAFHFTLPDKIRHDIGSDGRDESIVTLYFKALEFPSWEVLNDTKIALCSLAFMYVQAGQSRRAANYFTEAMRLVGGINLGSFNRDPFCKYANLELKAGRVEKARAALQLMPYGIAFGSLDKQQREYSDRCSSISIRRQKIIELLQDGDLRQAEGDVIGAKKAYTQATMVLAEITEWPSAFMCSLKARCWRKIVRLHATVDYQNERQFPTDLGNSLEHLKLAMGDCSNPVERVKCMLELGRAHLIHYDNVKLQEQFSFEDIICILETAFLRGDEFGINHLSRRLRNTLGSAYWAQMESLKTAEDEDEVVFLARSSGFLLANSANIEISGKKHSEADESSSPGEYFSARLHDLSNSSGRSVGISSRKQMQNYVKAIADQVEHFPLSWLVVSIIVGPSSELLVSRITADEGFPVTFRLCHVDWQRAIADLQDIVEQSRMTLSGHSAAEAAAWTSGQKKQWWDTRAKLDRLMSDSIAKFQGILGFWRSLFVKGTSTFASSYIQQCWSILSPENPRSVHHFIKLRTLLCAIADAITWLSETEVTEGLHHIADQLGMILSSSDVAIIQGLLRKNVRSNTEDTATRSPNISGHEYQLLSSISSEAIHKMKVAELKELLAAMKLNTNGLKKDLIERLLVARDELNCAGEDASTSTSKMLPGSTVLILDRTLQEFPWEGVDVLASCAGVTRMPSLDMVVKNVKQLQLQTNESDSTAMQWSVRRRRIRYILNPSGDLKATQKHMAPVLERQTDELGWEGVIGSTPDSAEFRRFLTDSDLIIYCGHGSGEKYLHREKIKSIGCGCSAALLFGCSSGRLESEGEFGPEGAVLSYLQAGSPGVLAMMWDVTDKDIDQLSVRVLNEWLLASSDSGGSKSLASVVQASRRVCKLPFLNGHAAVCYGLPLYVASDDWLGYTSSS